MVGLPIFELFGATVTVLTPATFSVSESAGMTRYRLASLNGKEYRNGVSVSPSEYALSESATTSTISSIFNNCACSCASI